MLESTDRQVRNIFKNPTYFMNYNVRYYRYVEYCMHRVRMLLHYKVKPFVVFDGGPLPSKGGTEESRESARKENKKKALEFMKSGQHAKASECFQKCVDITPEMAKKFIEALRRENIDYVVAPYEADAQLAYLFKQNKVSSVITEDSDLLVFGCKRVLFKLDKYGNGVEIQLDRLGEVGDQLFAGWSLEQFRQMCILSGCDYLKSIPGMGLKKAMKYLNQYKTAERVIEVLRADSSFKIPPDYELDFQRAELTFRHQLVFDSASRSLVHLDPLDEGLGTFELPFLGKHLEPEIATGVAFGDINPITLMPLPDSEPTPTPVTTPKYSSFKFVSTPGQETPEYGIKRLFQTPTTLTPTRTPDHFGDFRPNITSTKSCPPRLLSSQTSLSSFLTKGGPASPLEPAPSSITSSGVSSQDRNPYYNSPCPTKSSHRDLQKESSVTSDLPFNPFSVRVLNDTIEDSFLTDKENVHFSNSMNKRTSAQLEDGPKASENEKPNIKTPPVSKTLDGKMYAQTISNTQKSSISTYLCSTTPVTRRRVGLSRTTSASRNPKKKGISVKPSLPINTLHRYLSPQ
ncbi:Rad2 nuclease, variant 2 [Basidiobolus ranarum]|uniref:Rad2 nuclease, variant 2 n=1 Tax=Basidiobolus ranarum TaxID=34480 RepID=A0ABR2WPU7_9FUNG